MTARRAIRASSVRETFWGLTPIWAFLGSDPRADRHELGGAVATVRWLAAGDGRARVRLVPSVVEDAEHEHRGVVVERLLVEAGDVADDVRQERRGRRARDLREMGLEPVTSRRPSRCRRSITPSE